MQLSWPSLSLQNLHSYKVKIINPLKKSDSVLRHLHFNSRFDSLLALRVKLIEEFQDGVPSTVTFNVGYFEGQQHSKISMITADDLSTMYSRYPKGEITLWCDGSSGQEASSEHGKRKREDVSSSMSRRQEKEEVDAAFKELKEKHADTFEVPKLRLWARMIASNLHDNYETPPNVPAFQGSASKKGRQQSSLSDAISGAAVAFANALKDGNSSTTATTEKTSSSGMHVHSISPTKAVDLRMKNFEQLKYLQQLFDDGILSEKEYSELKLNILSTLKNLH